MSVRAMSAVWECSEVKGTEKLVLLAYADHADHHGEKIFPATDTVARKCGLSRRAVQKITSRLVEAGYLVLVEEGGGRGRTNVYQIPIDPKVGTLFTLSDSETAVANGSGPSEQAPREPGTSFTLSEKGEPEDQKGEPDDIKGEPGARKGERGSPDPSEPSRTIRTTTPRASARGVSGRREKRTSGRRNAPPIPPLLTRLIPEFPELWEERIRNAGRKRPTPSAEAKQLEVLSELLVDHGPDPVLATVAEASIGGYQGIFPDRHAATARKNEEVLDPGGWRRQRRREAAAELEAS